MATRATESTGVPDIETLEPFLPPVAILRRTMTNRAPRFPAITASLSALALALWLIPGANEVLQLERTAIAAGEFWRLVTGHLTHWTADHLGWDLAAFVLLGTLVERRSRRLLVAALATSALAISVGVMIFRPDLATYRGLSGIDSALFAAAVATQVLDGISVRSPSQVLIAIAAGIAFVAKLSFEITAAAPLFVAASAAFVPVPLAHLIGGVVGLIVSLPYSSSAKAAQVAAA